MANDRLLAIYLNDHLGGSAAAVERCRYSAERARGSQLGQFLESLAEEIEQDRRTLLRVMRSVDAKPSPMKQAVGRIAERIGRVKPNGQLAGQSPLTSLVDLELLSLGIEGKRRLWLALGDVQDDRVAEFDFATLAESALGQRERIEKYRLEVARSVFG